MRFSQKKFGFRGSGGIATEITASPFITITQALSHYNGNYFDATDPEDRNNWQVAGSTSYFVTTKTRGANLEIRTTSLYLQDRWQANSNLAFDIGARFETVRSDATGDIPGVDANSLVPRQAATYDPRANGRLLLSATYAHYAGKYSEAQFGRNTPVGNPSRIDLIYNGPSGQGTNFAPAFDLSNYQIYNGSFPTANVFFDEGIKAPLTREFTASVGSMLGRGFLKATYTQRNMSNFVEDFITTANGTTQVVRDGVDFGTFDNQVYRNSDDPVREYRAVHFLARYPLRDNWSAQANWTVQLRNHGNFEGEGINTPAISSLIGDRPELYVKDRHYPEGRLNDFQRHRVMAWTTYGAEMGVVGRADVSLLYRYNSGQTFSYIANSVPLTAIQRAAGQAAGYARLPATQQLFFGERGRGQFNGAHLVDIGLNYQIPVFREAGPFIKFDVFNVFNNDTLTAHDVTVNPDPNSPLDALGLPTGFIQAASFGQHTSNTSYPDARRWQVAFGVRW